MKIFLLLFPLVVVFNWAAPAFASYSDAQIQQMVDDKIMERQPTDTPQWWQGLGDNATGVLIGMFNAETNIFHKIRMVQGLGWLSTPDAISFVEQQAQDSDTDVIRNAAIRALANGQGSSQEDFIAKFLKNADPQTRLAAAESLRGMKDQRAKDLYDAYLKEEKVSWLVDKLNGKPLAATGLTHVSSSEDRISAEFEGTWRGYWISPKEQGNGMQTAQVVLQLKAPSSATSIQGNMLVVSHKTQTRSFQINDGAGKGVNVAGNLSEVLAAPSLSGPGRTKPPQLEFQSTLSRMNGTWVLEMKIASKASILVLKKD